MSICVYGKGKGMYHFLIWEQERSTAFFAMIFNMLKIFLNTYLEKLRREKDLNTHDSVFLIVTPLRILIKDKKYYFCLLGTLLSDRWKKKAVVTWLFHIKNLVIVWSFFSLCRVIFRHIHNFVEGDVV